MNLWQTPEQNGNFYNAKFENLLLISQKLLLKKRKNRELI